MAAFNADELRVMATALSYIYAHPEYDIVPAPPGYGWIIHLAAIINKLISSNKIFFHKDISKSNIKLMLQDPSFIPQLQELHAIQGQARPVPGPLVEPLEGWEGWAVVFPVSGEDFYFWNLTTGGTARNHPETFVPLPVPVPAEATVSAPTCRICLDAPPEIVANCGHALCIYCHNNFHTIRGEVDCCVCRQPVQAWTRLFL
jgi:hypothetical protein